MKVRKAKKVRKKKRLKQRGSYYTYPDISNDLSVIANKVSGVIIMDKTEPVEYIPTIFSSFNRAIELGGAPTGCIWLVYGPFGEGKTIFSLGMIISFLLGGNPAAFIDAEHAADTQRWFKALGGQGLLDNCLYKSPETYEETVEAIFKLIDNFRKGKVKKAITPDKHFLIVIDSINKLIPKDELKKIMEIGKGFPIRALFNSIFADKLVPIIGKSKITIILIAQEREKLDAVGYQRKTKIKGGKAFQFDSSVMVRVTKGPAIKLGSEKEDSEDEDSSKTKERVGQTHRIVVEKNKVGLCYESGKFFISNGKGYLPMGFDPAREAVEEAIHRKIIKKKGSIYTLPEVVVEETGIDKVDGKDNLIKELYKNIDGEVAFHSLVGFLNKDSVLVD